MQCQTFFDRLWQEYIAITPQAQRLQQLFMDDGNSIVNDHVAFRTYALPPISLQQLEPLILALGYRRFDHYQFKEKKLNAISYIHEDELQPRVFLSELKVNELSPSAQAIIHRLCAQIQIDKLETDSAFSQGLLWAKPSWQDYHFLLQESEYAAWMAVMGLRANHFTISVNHLRQPTMTYVLEKLHQAQVRLNQQGGEIKGNKASLLEQTATMADEIKMTFADGDTHTISSCYYEFAKRYADKDGKLYQGFVPANADAIFHSTDRKTDV